MFESWLMFSREEKEALSEMSKNALKVCHEWNDGNDATKINLL